MTLFARATDDNEDFGALLDSTTPVSRTALTVTG